MNLPINFKKCPQLFFAIFAFLIFAIPTSFLILKKTRAKELTPTNLIVANITTADAQIYWKGQPTEKYTITYYESSNPKVKTTSIVEIIGKDIKQNQYIYTSKISPLKPNTRYIFNIDSKKIKLNNEYSFRTKIPRDVISLPNLLTGQEGQYKLIQINSGEDVYIKNTQGHGTWLLENPGEDTSIQTYAKYSVLDDEVSNNQTSLLSLYPSPTYAQGNYIDEGRIKKLQLSKGINFTQIPIFINNSKERISSARELIQFSSGQILSIGIFRNDNWTELIKYENGTTYGSDFELIPGEVYMISTNNDIALPYVGKTYAPSIDITSLTGWNLLPASLLGITPITSKNILNREDLKILKQLAVWNQQKSLFDYNLKDSNEEIIGESIPLLTGDALFVKISY
jgi:hypothetical protein